MNGKNLVIGLVLAALVALAGLWLYNWVLGDTEAASGPVSAPTLDIETAVPTQVTLENTPTVAPAATETKLEPTEVADTAASETDAGLTIYQIDQSASQARFNIFEELRGSPNDVIGTTNQVAGQVGVDLANLSTAQVGEIVINTRTLATDDDRRNRAIGNRILNTDQYEFITFNPTEISGLNGSAEAGQSFNFHINGDLTIRDVTQPVEFEVTAQAESTDRLVGTASAVIQRSDYNLAIPSVPFVANVGEDITLEIDFVLTPA